MFSRGQIPFPLPAPSALQNISGRAPSSVLEGNATHCTVLPSPRGEAAADRIFPGKGTVRRLSPPYASCPPRPAFWEVRDGTAPLASSSPGAGAAAGLGFSPGCPDQRNPAPS